MLASVAAMQGRIAMWHALGDAVAPLDLKTVSSNVFTAPGDRHRRLVAGDGRRRRDRRARSCCRWPATPGPRCRASRDGFVKLFCRPGTGIVVGGVVVGAAGQRADLPGRARRRSQRLTVDQLAHAFTVYPSLSGSIAEAARRLHHH